MALFEFLFEGFRGDRMGSINIGGPSSDQPAWFVLLHLAIAAGLTAGGAAALHYGAGPYTFASWVLFGTVYAIYLLIAYLIRPAPDLDNVGWLGGFFDNPFRISDDVNRVLLFVVILLAPGRFVAQAIVDTVLLPFRSWA